MVVTDGVGECKYRRDRGERGSTHLGFAIVRSWGLDYESVMNEPPSASGFCYWGCRFLVSRRLSGVRGVGMERAIVLI